MIKFRAYLAATMLAGVVGLAGTSHAAKAPHIPTVEIPSTIFAVPVLQDVSSQNIVVDKLQFERPDYIGFWTTVTLDLQQDPRGKVAGTASVATTHPSGGNNYVVSGKVKAAKDAPGFKLKGLAEITKPNGKPGKAKLTVTAVMSGFEAVDLSQLPANSQDYRSTATYDINIKISGTGFNQDFSQRINVVANHDIRYQKASDDITFGLKDKPDSDYYVLQTPWGPTLADGSVFEIEGDGYFTLKAPKFMLTDIDYNWNGTEIWPNYSILKTPIGKFEGEVNYVGSPNADGLNATGSAGTRVGSGR